MPGEGSDDPQSHSQIAHPIPPLASSLVDTVGTTGSSVCGQLKNAEDNTPVTSLSELPPLPKLQRRVLRYVESEAPASVGLPGGSGLYLVLDDGDLAPHVSEELQKRGATALIIPAATVARLSPHSGCLESDLTDSDKQLQEQLGNICGVIALMPRSTQEDWDISYVDTVKDYFLAVQAVAPALTAHKSLWVSVTRLDGCMGLSGSNFNPLEGGLNSLGKVIAQEWPQVICRSIDLDPNWDAPEATQALLEELCRPGVMDVALRPNGRSIPVLEDVPVSAVPLRAWEPGQVMVVSGGARGVTAACVKVLARYFRPTFVLLGRSPLPQPESPLTASAPDEKSLKNLLFQQAKTSGQVLAPKELSRRVSQILANREVLASLAEIRSYGSRVEYISLDVRDAQAVADTLDWVRTEVGAISGLIHAAGVLADRKIADKTREQFNAVFDTKIIGLYNLLRATRSDDLRFIAFFSSVTARFGRPGQSDYAIANEIMNKAACLEARRRPQAKVVALGWGPWDGGMVNDGLRREFAKIGAELIPREQGALALANELIRGASEQHEVIMGSGFALDRESGMREQAYDFSVACSDFPALLDHQINGHPVLPQAVILEYFCQAVHRRYPRAYFLGVDHLQVKSMVRCAVSNDSATAEVQVVVQAAQFDGDYWRVPLQLLHNGQACATAAAVLSFHPVLNAFEPLPQPLEGNSAVSASEAYQRDLFHGPSWQGLRSIEVCSDAGIRAVAQAASPPGEWLGNGALGRWITDPRLSDCALQLGLVWIAEQRQRRSLPVSGAEYRQYCEKWPEQVQLTLQIRERNALAVSGDVYFHTSERVLASWRGVQWLVQDKIVR